MGRPINLFESLVDDVLRRLTDDEEEFCDAMAMALNGIPPHYYCRPETLSMMNAAEMEDCRFQAEESAKKALTYVRPRVRQLISQLIDIANSDFKTLHYNSVSC